MASEIKSSVQELWTLSGGTRTAVKTSRPWQPKLVFPETENCPFCSKRQEDEYAPKRGWKTFKNSNTPFSYHRLLIPTYCWNEAALRSLGGRDGLRTAWQIILAEITRTKALFPTWIMAHIGYGAGQNITHLHWHILAPSGDPQTFIIFGSVPRDYVHLDDSQCLATGLTGIIAGQAVIYPALPKGDIKYTVTADFLFEDNSPVLDELADETAKLIEMYNKKFNFPDYALVLALNSKSHWYVRYTPKLNNWGGTEFAALDHGTPFVLPWSHEATAEHLKSND